jgi:hypothetical protein
MKLLSLGRSADKSKIEKLSADVSILKKKLKSEWEKQKALEDNM